MQHKNIFSADVFPAGTHNMDAGCGGFVRSVAEAECRVVSDQSVVGIVRDIAQPYELIAGSPPCGLDAV